MRPAKSPFASRQNGELQVPFPMVTNDPAGSPPQCVGATAVPLDVATEGATTSIPLDPRVGRELAAELARDDPAPRGTAHLRLEAITGQRPANLAVYLEGPGGASHRAGVIGLYGLAQATRPDRDGEGGTGMTFSLDVSEVLARLWRATPLGPAQLRVRIAPTRALPPSAVVRIGRVSLLRIPEGSGG
jgi:hypothetical protein